MLRYVIPISDRCTTCDMHYDIVHISPHAAHPPGRLKKRSIHSNGSVLYQSALHFLVCMSTVTAEVPTLYLQTSVDTKNALSHVVFTPMYETGDLALQ